ncbi:hypothetical protein HY623_01285 [Candidatus Uhrbacteria bacterium]|nr:hypothetical protein [Candidatus Uhrbacteria bacterium]
MPHEQECEVTGKRFIVSDAEIELRYRDSDKHAERRHGSLRTVLSGGDLLEQ